MGRFSRGQLTRRRSSLARGDPSAGPCAHGRAAARPGNRRSSFCAVAVVSAFAADDTGRGRGRAWRFTAQPYPRGHPRIGTVVPARGGSGQGRGPDVVTRGTRVVGEPGPWQSRGRDSLVATSGRPRGRPSPFRSRAGTCGMAGDRLPGTPRRGDPGASVAALRHHRRRVSEGRRRQDHGHGPRRHAAVAHPSRPDRGRRHRIPTTGRWVGSSPPTSSCSSTICWPAWRSPISP